MKRYKLICTYPESPDKGTIVYYPHRYKNAYEEEYKMKNDKNVVNFIFYSRDYIEKSPKFWKKL